MSENIIKCPECGGDFQRLVCFSEGRVLKPPSIKMEFSDIPDDWK